MKIDWFWFITGIAGIILGGIIIFLKKSLAGAIILIFFGVIYLLRSYYQDRMSLRRLFKK